MANQWESGYASATPQQYGYVTDGQEGVLDFDVEYPERLSRGLIFVKWLLIIPHFFALALLSFLLVFVTIIAWFAILFTGRYPRAMWDFAIMTNSWATRVSVYIGLMRDEYPPFGDDTYPMDFEISYPSQLSRWKIFVKGFMLIPHIFILYFLGIASNVITFIAWFAILFTGRYPEGMFRFAVGVLRWQMRVYLYALLLTDVYPPFSLD